MSITHNLPSMLWNLLSHSMVKECPHEDRLPLLASDAFGRKVASAYDSL